MSSILNVFNDPCCEDVHWCTLCTRENKMCKRKVMLKIDFENIDENYIHIFLKHLFCDIKQMIF